MDIVIVGAGQAGAWVARSLRTAGSAANIVLVGDEQHLPYERPPLSKALMLDGDRSGLELLGAKELDRLRISFLRSERIISIDRNNKSVRAHSGAVLPYDKLVLTTGGRARRLDLTDTHLPNALTLRTIEDAEMIAERLRPGANALIIGGGWIGLELAASARRKGCQVTLVEAGSRLCARSVPPIVSDYLARLHVEQGVSIRLGVSVAALKPLQDGLLAEFKNGADSVRADFAIVGIGLTPNVELAQKAGLEVDNGILVDRFGCTSDPDIYAAGDATSQVSPWRQGRVRLESWANAQNQGIAVGSTLAGYPKPHEEIPWFWSDQYQLNLQILGFPNSELETIARGSIESGKFCLFQLVDQRIHAVIAANAARELKLAKRLMLGRVQVRPEDLANDSVRLDRLAS